MSELGQKATKFKSSSSIESSMKERGEQDMKNYLTDPKTKIFTELLCALPFCHIDSRLKSDGHFEQDLEDNWREKWPVTRLSRTLVSTIIDRNIFINVSKLLFSLKREKCWWLFSTRSQSYKINFVLKRLHSSKINWRYNVNFETNITAAVAHHFRIQVVLRRNILL